jgi:hypothetical protein
VESFSVLMRRGKVVLVLFQQMHYQILILVLIRRLHGLVPVVMVCSNRSKNDLVLR